MINTRLVGRAAVSLHLEQVELASSLCTCLSFSVLFPFFSISSNSDAKCVNVCVSTLL